MTPTQTFCSFLAVLGPAGGDDTETDDAFERLLGVLPRYTARLSEHRGRGLRLALALPEANALHRCLLLREGSRTLLVQGDFYRPVPEAGLRALLRAPQIEQRALGAALRGLTGAFNGFLADEADGTCVAFTDQFGFNFLYYAREGGRTWLSSSLWPLMRLGPARVSRASVEDIVLLGYPTGDRTILEGVSAVLPGRTVLIGPAGASSEAYLPRPARRPAGMAEALDGFLGAFHDHFRHVGGLIDRERFVATVTGGHDTRVVLNAFLGSGIRPTCLTGTGFPTKLTEDAMRAMRVAALAGCERHMLDYTRPDALLDADAFFMSEGGGTGLWMANLALEGRRYGDVLYCGFTGDVLSGSPEAVNPRLHSGVESLAREVFLSAYEYQSQPAALCAGLLGTSLDDVLARYTATFDDYRGLGLHDAYLLQNIDNRNFRRIGYFANAVKIGLPSVSLFHDQAVARAYLDLPEDLLTNERLHRRLCSIAAPALAWVPANPWHVPMWLEPLLWNYVRSNAKKAVRLARGLRASRASGRQAAAPPDRSAPLDERYGRSLDMTARAGLLDVEAVKNIMRGERYDDRGHIFAYRLEVLAKLVLFARGEPTEDLALARLFPPVARTEALAPR